MPEAPSNLIIPSLEGFAGTLDLETVAALGLSRIEGADTLDIPLVGRLDDAMTATPNLGASLPSAIAARLRFGMKEREPQPERPIVHYDQSFFV